jgi:hypothetical protein
MKQLRLVGLAVIAVLALGAFFVANASALALPEFSPATNKGSTEGGKAKFTEKGGIAAVECESSKGTTKITSADEGEFEETYKGCKALLSGKCTGLTNSEKGAITVAGVFHPGWVLLSDGTVSVGIVFLLTNAKEESQPVHFECEKTVVLVTVHGCVPAIVEPINKKSKTLTITLKQKEGAQELTEDYNNSGEKESCLLHSEKNSEAEKQAGQENTTKATYETEGELIE